MFSSAGSREANATDEQRLRLRQDRSATLMGKQD